MGDLLAILVLGLISVSQLWEGVQCSPCELNAPKEVSVQKGLCVAIPCNFTYSHPDFVNTDTLYGYWYESRHNGEKYPAFATNDGKKEIMPGARGRFHLSEKLEEGDCSLFITDAQESDTKTYFFRIEKGKGKCGFYTSTVSVRVTETPTPELQILGKLWAGQPVNLTCTAASCPWKSSELSWLFMRNISWNLRPLSNGTSVSSTVSNFVPLAADNGQPLTCQVTYGLDSASPVRTEKRIYLDVSYPPQRLQIRGEQIQKNGREINLTGLSYTEAQEGDSLHLRCVAEGNPLPSVTWASKTKTLLDTSDGELILRNVKQQDMGRYTCQAQNTEGSSEITFQVYMAHSPKACSQANNSCWKEGDGFQCNCSICSFPRPEIQWVVDGETLKENTSNNEMEVISRYKIDKTTSILLLKGAWNGRHSVLCHGNSSSGETTLNFLLYHFKENSLKQNVVSGVVGALIMFVIVVIIVLIVVVPRNQNHNAAPRCGNKCSHILKASEMVFPPQDAAHTPLARLQQHRKTGCQRASKPITDPETCTDRSMLVFSGNPSDVKEEAKSVPKVPEKPEKSPDDGYAAPQDLYYATIQFSGLKPVPDVILEKDTTEYAEIKPL